MTGTKLAYLVGSNDLRSSAATAASSGFNALSVPAALLDPRGLSTTGRREVRHVLSQRNLAAAALRHDLPGRGLTADADADRVLDELRPVLELARDCAFACVTCDLGMLPRAEAPPPRRKPIEPGMAGLIVLPDAADIAELTTPPRPLSESERQHVAFVADVLREVGQLVDRVGVPVAFGASLATTADLSAAVASADCPLFFREIDPAASVEELKDDAEAVVKVSPEALHVRARDALTGSGGKTRPAAVGEGDVPWRDLLEALADADFAGFITCEGGADAARRARSILCP